jgi:hypothetical protein
MPTPKGLYNSLVHSLDEYFFNYPDRRPLNIHESHIDNKCLLGIRVVAFIYMSMVYVWTLLQMPSFNTNIIYLTMVGYTLSWLYFGLTIQHYFLRGAFTISTQYTLH